MESVKLSWYRQDCEQRFGVPGARLTNVNTWFSGLIAAAMTAAVFGALLLVRESYVAQMLIERGMNIPYVIVFFTMWALTILFLKWRKIAYQKRALKYEVVPQESGFILGPANVRTIMDNVYETVDDPKHFVLFNRIVIALSNLQNLGRVTDVDDILRSQADHDESVMETSYSLLRGIVWAIPVLGFIGTVLGLSAAIASFTDVLNAGEGIEEIKAALGSVTSGLATAFETTLQGLVAALAIQMTLTFLKKSEEEFLDACQEYCTKHVVNRLRIMPYETTAEE